VDEMEREKGEEYQQRRCKSKQLHLHSFSGTRILSRQLGTQTEITPPTFSPLALNNECRIRIHDRLISTATPCPSSNTFLHQ
jgi:hypothetical protein